VQTETEKFIGNIYMIKFTDNFYIVTFHSVTHQKVLVTQLWVTTQGLGFPGIYGHN
jgi:hypothetical protein